MVLKDKYFEVVPNIFDWVQIRRIRRPVNQRNTYFSKLILDCVRIINRGIILHENKAGLLIPRYLIFEYLEVRARGVTILLRLKIAVHYIEIRALNLARDKPKVSLNHNRDIAYLLVSQNHSWRLFIIPRGSKTLLLCPAFPPLRRILVTPYILTLLIEYPVFSFFVPS